VGLFIDPEHRREKHNNDKAQLPRTTLQDTYPPAWSWLARGFLWEAAVLPTHPSFFSLSTPLDSKIFLEKKQYSLHPLPISEL
jgi:hypothetical protein